uniref:Thymocyte selection associated family member 2 n=1 Tax=Lates calcarifer TaxID=8187 RepID=A0A4W6DGI8_LATCA
KEPFSGLQLIASLDDTSLPKILQVCSGVYFQGSIYEISGSEVCFSTGDLIKVTGIELLSVCCEDICNNEKFELPINHKGWFVLRKKQTKKTPDKCVMRLATDTYLSLRLIQGCSRGDAVQRSCPPPACVVEDFALSTPPSVSGRWSSVQYIRSTPS